MDREREMFWVRGMVAAAGKGGWTRSESKRVLGVSDGLGSSAVAAALFEGARQPRQRSLARPQAVLSTAGRRSRSTQGRRGGCKVALLPGGSARAGHRHGDKRSGGHRRAGGLEGPMQGRNGAPVCWCEEVWERLVKGAGGYPQNRIKAR
jgi:hypothetical protein